jgi:excisionase family DNA binding protein
MSYPQMTFSLRQAADLIGISVRTLRRMIGRGELTPVVIGKRKRINADDLARAINGSRSSKTLSNLHESH